MQQRSPVVIAAIAVVAVVGAILLVTFLNRGPDSGALTGKVWQLSAITESVPAFQGVIPAAEQPLYTVEFETDGSLSARADCNQLAGDYELSGNDGMTITLGASTLVACPDGSYGSIFAHGLGTVTTWVIANDELTLTTAEGGTGTFVVGSARRSSRRRPRAPASPPRAEPQPDAIAKPDALADAEPHAEPDAQPDAGRDRDRRPVLHRGPERVADGRAHRGADARPSATPAPRRRRRRPLSRPRPRPRRPPRVATSRARPGRPRDHDP